MLNAPPNIVLRLALFPLLLASACSLVGESVSTNVLLVSSWQNRRIDLNPGGSQTFVAEAQNQPNALGKRLNPAVEPVEEFTTAIGRDGSLYVAYSTRLNSTQTVSAQEDETSATNVYTEIFETPGFTTNRTVTRTFSKDAFGNYTLLNEQTALAPNGVVANGKPEGVWVRILRYNTAAQNWEVIFASPEPAPFSGLKIAFVPGRTFPYVAAVSNGNRLAVFGRPSVLSELEFIQPAGTVGNLNGGRNPASVSQLSVFNEGDRLFISFIEDNRYVVGYVRNLQWQEDIYAHWDTIQPPSEFGMASSQSGVFGFWWSPHDQQTVVSGYNPSSAVGRRWSLLNRLAATESPSIKSRFYTENGLAKLDVYLGYVYSASKFFQLAQISNNQVYITIPPINSFNDRYDFAIDTLGRVLYVRVNAGGLIQTASWSSGGNVWTTGEPPIDQDNDNSPYRTFPDSPIALEFVGGTRPFMTFIRHDRYLQALEGNIAQNRNR